MFPSTSSVVPLSQCKTIYFVRHGQAEHNAAVDVAPEQYRDADLTMRGQEQAKGLRYFFDTARCDLVVVSPLRRTLRTAALVFNYTSRGESAQVNRDKPPLVVMEEVREVALDGFQCNFRRNITEQEEEFPFADFSLVSSNEDRLDPTLPPSRSTEKRKRRIDDPEKRAATFVSWLASRLETRIAIVTHGGYLYYLQRAVEALVKPPTPFEKLAPFHNCEVREILLHRDRGLLGNWKGEVPSYFWAMDAQRCHLRRPPESKTEGYKRREKLSPEMNIMVTEKDEHSIVTLRMGQENAINANVILAISDAKVKLCSFRRGKGIHYLLLNHAATTARAHFFENVQRASGPAVVHCSDLQKVSPKHHRGNSLWEWRHPASVTPLVGEFCCLHDPLYGWKIRVSSVYEGKEEENSDNTARTSLALRVSIVVDSQEMNKSPVSQQNAASSAALSEDSGNQSRKKNRKAEEQIELDVFHVSHNLAFGVLERAATSTGAEINDEKDEYLVASSTFVVFCLSNLHKGYLAVLRDRYKDLRAAPVFRVS